MAVTGWRNAGYGLLVIGGLIAMVVFPGLVSAALPAVGPPLRTARLDIGYGVTIEPPPGARLDLAGSRPGAGDVLMLAEGMRLKLTAQQFRGPVGRYLAHVRRKLRRDESLRPVGPREVIRTSGGVVGERGSLIPETGSGAGEAGCYAVLTADGVGLLVLVTPVPSCAELPAPVRDAIDSVSINPTGAA